MLMLNKTYGALRLEAACARALKGPRVNYTMVKTILERGLDAHELKQPELSIPLHDNIRGKDHYI